MILPPVESEIAASWFNQYVIKPLQGGKCSSYFSLVDLSIVLPRVFFLAALRPRTNLLVHCYFHVHARTYTNVTVVIDVLAVVYNRTWENRVMLSLHGQLVLDTQPRCWPGLLKLTNESSTRQLLAPSVNISA